MEENGSRINTGNASGSSGASGSAPAPGDSPVPGTYTDEQIAQLGMEAYFDEPETTNEVIPFHDSRSVVSTAAPSGGRMDPRSVGSETG
eukprot:6598924-Karenia_brevis.AAC.1